MTDQPGGPTTPELDDEIPTLVSTIARLTSKCAALERENVDLRAKLKDAIEACDRKEPDDTDLRRRLAIIDALETIDITIQHACGHLETLEQLRSYKGGLCAACQIGLRRERDEARRLHDEHCQWLTWPSHEAFKGGFNPPSDGDCLPPWRNP